MNESIQKNLVIEAASKVHDDWCNSELSAFFERAQKAFDGEHFGDAFQKACYKGDNKRNEVVIDIGFIMGHLTLSSSALTNIESFMKLVNLGAIEVKRFAKRDLTKEEQEKAGLDYRNGEENILKPFMQLSASSKKENLDAAIGASNVYIEFSKAGISTEEMQKNPEFRNLIGIAIHTDWLKRNMEHPNESLKVPYNQLDEWTRNQDLTVFDALISVVKQNPEKYKVERVANYSLPNYEEEEQKFFGHIR